MAAHTLGASGFGVIVLINFYVLLIGNFCVLQGWQTLVRFGSQSLSTEAPAEFQRLVRHVSLIEFASGLASMLLAAGLSRWAGHVFGWPDELWGYAALYSLAIITNMQSTAGGILSLFGRFDLLSLQQTSGPLVRMIGAGLAWLLDAGLPGFLLAWMFGSIAEGFVQWALALGELRRRGLLTGLWRRQPGAIADRHPELLRFLIANNLDVGLTDAGNRVTPLAVGAVLDPAAVGLYHLTLRIGMVLQQPVLLIGRTIYPELTQLAADEQWRRLGRLVLRTGLSALAGGLVVTLILALIGAPLLRLVGGGDFGEAKGLLLMIALARTIYLLGVPFASGLVAIGRPQVTLSINFVITLGGLPILYAMLKSLALAGAGLHAIAFSVAIVAALMLAVLRLMPRPA